MRTSHSVAISSGVRGRLADWSCDVCVAICSRLCALTPRVQIAHTSGGGGSDEAQCACGTMFCFGCAAVPHRPAWCDMRADWQKKVNLCACVRCAVRVSCCASGWR
jgi:hypothetical protein